MQKTQECQQLRSELNRLKISTTASSLGLATTPSHTQFGSRRQSLSVPTSPEYAPQTQSPSTPLSAASSAHSPSPLARYSHTRTASLSSRSSTPTPSLHMRSMTPGPGHSRSMTPAPPLPRATTPALPILSRPPVPPKPRTLSSPSPPSHFGNRGPVDDREQKDKERSRHQRWIPSPEPPTGRRSRLASLVGSSRTMTSATSTN